MRIAPPVALSPEERAGLHRWARTRQMRSRAIRARIVLRAADGEQDQAIASAEGVSRATAARWRARFRLLRLPGLEDRARPVLSQAGVPAETVHGIVRATRSQPPSGRRTWTTRTLAREFGVSHMTVRRIWQTYRIRPDRFPPWPMRPDPTAPLVPRDVLGLYLRPPEGVLILSLMPRPPRWRAPDLWPTERTDPAPNLPWSVAPWVKGVAPSPAQAGRRSGAADRRLDLLRFVGGLDRRIPRDVPIRLVGTNTAIDGTDRLAHWRVRRPNMEVVAARDWSEWKRRVLWQLRELGAPGPPPGRTPNRGEAIRSLSLFVQDYGEESGPFEWLAPPLAAKSGVAAFRLRYDLAVTGHPGFKSRTRPEPSVVSSRASDANARQMARNVLRRCLRVTAGETVTIDSWTATLAEANAFVLEALDIGARPMLLYQDEPTYWAATTQSRIEHLGHIGAHRKAAIERTNALVSFFGPSDRERFHALPAAVNSRLRDYNDELYRAASRSGVRAAQMALGRASPASARMYGVDLARWRKELIDGCLVAPEELRRRGAPIAAAFASGREVRISHRNGTDLRLRLRRRKPQLSDGVVPPARRTGSWSLVTLPAGVVVVAVDERHAEGTFRSNVRTAIGMSDTVGEVAGGCWTFDKGRLTRFSYDEGRELFAQSYAQAGPGRDLPGCLSIGLNDAISVAPLLEDQGAGTVLLHIGRNDHVGGTNHVPWWSWLMLRGATVVVDERTVLRDGAWAK